MIYPSVLWLVQLGSTMVVAPRRKKSRDTELTPSARLAIEARRGDCTLEGEKV